MISLLRYAGNELKIVLIYSRTKIRDHIIEELTSLLLAGSLAIAAHAQNLPRDASANAGHQSFPCAAMALIVHLALRARRVPTMPIVLRVAGYRRLAFGRHPRVHMGVARQHGSRRIHEVCARHFRDRLQDAGRSALTPRAQNPRRADLLLQLHK